MKVADVLVRKKLGQLTIKPNETIGTLARRLQQHRIGVMAVSADGQTLDGIISERDIAHSLADRRGELHLLPVSALMTRHVVTCTPECSLSEVMQLMLRHHIRHVPVTEDDHVVGVVSIRDIMEYRLKGVERRSKLLETWIATSD